MLCLKDVVFLFTVCSPSEPTPFTEVCVFRQQMGCLVTYQMQLEHDAELLHDISPFTKVNVTASAHVLGKSCFCKKPVFSFFSTLDKNLGVGLTGLEEMSYAFFHRERRTLIHTYTRTIQREQQVCMLRFTKGIMLAHSLHIKISSIHIPQKGDLWCTLLIFK